MILPNWPETTNSELDAEVNSIIETFNSRIDALPANLRSILCSSKLISDRGTGLSHYLPFWLDDALTDGRLREEARRMVLANRFGQVFCLLRDAVIDGDKNASPELMWPLDALFYSFIHEYQLLFDGGDLFWQHFERYWMEYLEALAWERQRNQLQGLKFDQDDFYWMGLKFSPVKICVAGVLTKGKRQELLPELERFIEMLQTGHQLLDDLADWKTDLVHKRRTWPLQLSGVLIDDSLTEEDVEQILWTKDIVTIVYQRIQISFAECEKICKALNLVSIHKLLEEFNLELVEVMKAVARRTSDSRIELKYSMVN